MTTETEEIGLLREILRGHIEILKGIFASEDAALADVRDQFKPRIVEAVRAKTIALLDLERAIAAQAIIDNADMPMHLLYEWVQRGYGPCKLTGRVGRYEIRSPDSYFRGVPHGVSIGDKFIRILKKDGTPSLNWESCRSLGKWLPEGEIPE